MATSTVLFDTPQHEIESMLTSRMYQAAEIHIVTGFATPGGLGTIADPLMADPEKLNTLIIGAATYPGFETLDELLAMGVPKSRLHVHLGHTGPTGTPRNPFARFRPMLHSKVYYMEFGDGTACSIVGSHNVTTYALSGLNGEAAVLLEGVIDDPEFEKVRAHIGQARAQAIPYDPTMKQAYAWWTREFIDGIKAEMRLPTDWITVRTILLFAQSENGEYPATGDHLYFELPEGIEQIESLKTETHLFLFDQLPPHPRAALDMAANANARYICDTLGVENQQGNKELVAQWRIDDPQNSILKEVTGGTYRPTPAANMQQVRARVKIPSIPDYEYLFERESKAWVPEFSREWELSLKTEGSKKAAVESSNDKRVKSWKLVKGLKRKEKAPLEKDQMALKLASPESGSFVLISLRRRKREQNRQS